MSDKLRRQLHNELRLFYENVYFQPPANIRMEYPCIVYSRYGKAPSYASDDIYKDRTGYTLTVIEKDPTSNKAEEIVRHFRYARLTAYQTVESLHQTTITIYY